MFTRTIRAETELQDVVRGVLSLLHEKESAHIIALQGDLGAGKTAFTKALARELGVVETVTSPTFVIMKSYQVTRHAFFKTLTHIDAYRIESNDEMRVLGFKELLTDPKQIVAIEWPERILELIPNDAVRVQIEIKKDGTRTITYGN